MTKSAPTAADAKLITLEPSARQRLIIVLESFGRTMEPVEMESMLSLVTVKKGSQGTHVKSMSMTVK